MNKNTGMICNIVARMQAEIDALSGSTEELDALRDRVVELEAALQEIAQHDMQAIALDALRPGERIRGEQ